MRSNAATVEQYLKELPPDRREAISAVRDVVRKNIDGDIEEGMNYGMIGYYIPHSVYPAGYHCNPKQPLPYACIASQKNYMSLYVMSAYQGCGDGETPVSEDAKWFKSEWAKTGKKLDMGQCCIRFRRLEDLPLDLIGEAIRRVPGKKFIAQYERALAMPRQTRPASRSKALAKAAAKPKTASAKSISKSAAKKKPRATQRSKSRKKTR